MQYRVVGIAAVAIALAGCRDVPQPLAPSEPSMSVGSTGSSTWPLIYRNFVPDFGFNANPYAGWTINGFLSPTTGQAAIAQRVTPGSDVALREVRVAVTHFAGTDSLRVHVQRDSAGLPGPVLETIPLGGFSPLAPAVALARSKVLPVLPKGVPVWISLTASGPGVIAGWNFNSAGDVALSGSMASTQGGSSNGPWSITNGLTRGAFQLNGSPPSEGLKPITLDDLTLLPGGALVIDGAPWYYAATFSNRTTSTRSNVALQAWIEQGAARRAAGGQLVSCAAATGALPFGTCIAGANGVSASNASAGRGTLVPGPAGLVVQVVQLTASGPTTLATRAIPVTLTSAPTNPAVLGVTVAPSETTINQIGQTVQLTATVQAVGGASTAVAWSSSNVLTAVVNSTGRVTVVAEGAAFITATSVADPTKRASALVSVLSAPAVGSGMQVAPGMPVLQVGRQVLMAAQIPGDLSGPANVVWSSTNTSVAVVNTSTGLLTTVSAGAALITATSVSDPSKSASALVSVGTTPAVGQGVNVSPGRLDLVPGSTGLLFPQIVGGVSNILAVTWTSSNAAVASVSAGGSVTGLAPGSATITAASKADPSKSVTIPVTVTDLAFTSPATSVNVSTGAVNPPANPTSIALDVTAKGPSSIFVPPWSKVEFFVSSGGTLVSIGTGSLTAVLDNGVVRLFRYSLHWTPGTAFGTGPQSVVARAYSASGSSVTLPPNNFITLTDP